MNPIHNNATQPHLSTGILFTLLAICAPFLSVDASQWRWQDVDRVVAFSDARGVYDNLVMLLERTGVVDDELAWSGGSTHLVSTGNLLDWGRGSRQILELLMELEKQAEAAGGRVHVILGDHETKDLTGDLQGASKAESRLFADEVGKKLEQWLLEKPFIIVINDIAFAHSGLSPWTASRDLETINAELHTELQDYLQARNVLIEAGVVDSGHSLSETLEVSRSLVENASETPEPEVVAAAARMVELEAGPLFVDGPHGYRGTAACNPFAETSVLQKGLQSLGAKRLVVGHTTTPTRRVTSRLQGSVLMINTGMAAYPHDGRITALLADRHRIQVLDVVDRALRAPTPEPRSPIPDMTVNDIERFLENAPVVASEELGIGITKPRLVTLEQDGVQLRAIFKYGDVGGRGANARRELYRHADSFRYDIAAYRLDKMLGLDMVPITVTRKIGHKPGALQLWHEQTVNRLQAREEGLSLAPSCPLSRQLELMYMFDYLVSNDDRNLTNMLQDKNDGNLMLIDHSRAFRTRKGWPKYYKNPELTIDDYVAGRLAALDAGQLNLELARLLQSSQIRYILRRRDRLLQDYSTY